VTQRCLGAEEFMEKVTAKMTQNKHGDFVINMGIMGNLRRNNNISKGEFPIIPIYLLG